MKKYFLLFVLSIACTNIIYGQVHFHHVAAKVNALNRLSDSNTGIVWNWDTIVTYETTNQKYERHTQICDSYGKS